MLQIFTTDCKYLATASIQISVSQVLLTLAMLPLQILPMHKVKRLIKSESSVKAVSGEASFAIARATVSLMQLATL